MTENATQTDGNDGLRVVMVGAGNLATNLGKALRRTKHQVVQVYSRTEASATALAAILECPHTTVLDGITRNADAYIVSIKDSALPTVLPQLCKGREEAVFMHTAGSMPMQVFAGLCRHYGVFYPMQTFSKSREVDFGEIPCFLEANDAEAMRVIGSLASAVSRRTSELSSDERKYLHLAAVFACNFANHCYALADRVLSERGISFDTMLPLIDETARKVHAMRPAEAQTGPAIRYDENVIGRHLRMLDDQRMRDIYELLSKSIHDKL